MSPEVGKVDPVLMKDELPLISTQQSFDYVLLSPFVEITTFHIFSYFSGLLIIFLFNTFTGIRSSWTQTCGLSSAAKPPSIQVQGLPGAQESQRHNLPSPLLGASHFDFSKMV